MALESSTALRLPAPSSSMSAVTYASPAWSAGSAAEPVGMTTTADTSGSACRSTSHTVMPMGPLKTSGAGGAHDFGALSAGRGPSGSALASSLGVDAGTGGCGDARGRCAGGSPQAPKASTAPSNHSDRTVVLIAL